MTAAGATPSGRSATREWLLASAAVLLTALVSAWPVLLRPTAIPAHQDPLFSTWRLYQWARNLATRPLQPFDGNVFFPASDVLLYSDLVVLPATLGAPLILAGVPPLLVYNGLVLASALAGGLAMYLFARDLSGSRAGALVAAAIFTGAPYRVDHIVHLELLWAFGIPLAFWAVHRLFRGDTPAARYLFLGLAGQFLCSIYYGLFLVTVLPVVAAVVWLLAPVALSRRTLRHTAAALAAAALVVGLYAQVYEGARSALGDRSRLEIQSYSAEAANYFSTPSGNLLWGWTPALLGGREKQLSAGVVAYALAVPALLPPVTPWSMGLLAGAITAFDGSRGTNGVFYPLLHRLVPPYRGLRVPARFAMLVVATVAPLAALGVARLQRDLTSVTLARVLALLLGLGLLIEYATSIGMRELPLHAPPVYAWLGRQPPTVIAHLPMPRPDRLPGAEADFQFFAQHHRHTLVNGISGYYPRSYIQMLDRMLGFPDSRSLAELRRLGVTLVLLHAGYYADRLEFERVRRELSLLPDLELVENLADHHGDGALVYRLR